MKPLTKAIKRSLVGVSIDCGRRGYRAALVTFHPHGIEIRPKGLSAKRALLVPWPVVLDWSKYNAKRLKAGPVPRFKFAKATDIDFAQVRRALLAQFPDDGEQIAARMGL